MLDFTATTVALHADGSIVLSGALPCASEASARTVAAREIRAARQDRRVVAWFVVVGYREHAAIYVNVWGRDAMAKRRAILMLPTELHSLYVGRGV